jgi:ketosteroid isomerase-like protein
MKGGLVMERTAIERTIKDAYAARKRGDVDSIVKMFTEDAHFQLAGAYVTSPVAVETMSSGDLKAALTVLVGIFEWLEQDIQSILVEGDKAAVHWRGKIRSTVTGEIVDTDLVDLFEVKDGRISSFVEFCDTALAARLMQADDAPPVAAA